MRTSQKTTANNPGSDPLYSRSLGTGMSAVERTCAWKNCVWNMEWKCRRDKDGFSGLAAVDWTVTA